MDAFGEMFQAVVHDHGRRPRNFGDLDQATHVAEGVNPLTGDHLKIQVRVGKSEIIESAGFTGKASALATTSASIMTGVLRGLSVSEARSKISETLAIISGEAHLPAELPEDEYAVLLEIRQFPHRIRCASLAWKTAAQALYKP